MLGDRFALSSLIGKQLCLAMDIPSMPLNSKTVATFKSVTGGDPLTTDIKYRSYTTFTNRATFILGTNHPFLIQVEDPALYRRTVVIPFYNSITKKNQDTDLFSKMEDEQEAIIYDALLAYRRLCANNYKFSGNFEINQMFCSTVCSPSFSVEQAILEFVETQCTPAVEGAEFVEDFFLAFCEIYGTTIISNLQFSNSFLKACDQLGYSCVARCGKRRRQADANPQASLSGIMLKSRSVDKNCTVEEDRSL